jgi:outer membrane protein
MNKNIRIIKSLIISVAIAANVFTTFGQPVNASSKNDSLSLKQLIGEVVSTHPSVKAAEEALNNADARIGLARTGYYPTVDASASFSNIGPVTKISIPSMGTFQLYPENNYSAALNVRQLIYDFGRTKTNIAIETESKKIGELSLDQVRQKMSMATISSFYTLAFLQHAIKITDEQLSTLEKHLKYIETMRATGSATEYQVLSTKVKISAAESQKSDLLAALKIQQAYLCALTGNDSRNAVVKEELNASLPDIQVDSLLNYALRNRYEVSINRERTMVADLRYQMTRTLNKPIINFQATGGTKNGYLPNLGKLKGNYAVGVGIAVPIFDGMKTKYNLLQTQSAISSLDFESEGTRRTISSEVKEAREYVISASEKEEMSALQLEQALKAYSLAETSFRSGVITNLELLDANTAVSQSKLSLLKAQIDFNASIYRLKAALGEKLW